MNKQEIAQYIESNKADNIILSIYDNYREFSKDRKWIKYSASEIKNSDVAFYLLLIDQQFDRLKNLKHSHIQNAEPLLHATLNGYETMVNEFLPINEIESLADIDNFIMNLKSI